MRKIVSSILFCTLCILGAINIAQAQEVANPMATLQAKKTAVEANINAKQEATLAKIESKIAKAKASGKSTEKLEQKRQQVIDRITAKQKELNARIDAQKAKIQ
ncbi:MAG: hypothetical protein IJ218_00980 [Alphaproteobacteria bacterium]|nr:hypothetical protein [Alphaproteobacteria bacterium]